MAADTAEVNHQDLALFSLTVWTYRMGEAVSLMIHVGDRLGLYKAMAGAGPITSAELAAETDLDERMVREWLFGQAAAKLLDHSAGDGSAPNGSDRFELTAVQAAVLADEEDSPAFSCGAFEGGPGPDVVDAVIESFHTGQGITYEQQGPKAAAGLARMTGQSTRLNLLPRVIPALGGIVDRLNSGASVVDVGCGAGVALIEIAAAYPATRCIGLDPSPSAIALGRSRATELGLSNVEFFEGFAADLPERLGPDPSVDLVMTLDVLHDMPYPDQAADAVRSIIAEDGTWLIKEIRSSGDFVSDLRNPLLPLFYGFSLFSCLQSAVSEPGGMGLGTLGLHADRLRSLVGDAGFSNVTDHDFNEPANVYYEVRI